MATTSWQGTRLGLIRVLRYEELGGLLHEEEGKDAAVVSLVMEWRRSKIRQRKKTRPHPLIKPLGSRATPVRRGVERNGCECVVCIYMWVKFGDVMKTFDCTLMDTLRYAQHNPSFIQLVTHMILAS